MPRRDLKVIVGIVENVLKLPVWHDTFMLRRAHNRILDSLNTFKKKQIVASSSQGVACDRVPVFIEVYQNNLGIITLSRILTSLGDSAFGKNIYSSYREAKIFAESHQRNQKFIAYVEVLVLPEKVRRGVSGSGGVVLEQGAILLSNVKGAWFRDVYYKFDMRKKLFVRG